MSRSIVADPKRPVDPLAVNWPNFVVEEDQGWVEISVLHKKSYRRLAVLRMPIHRARMLLAALSAAVDAADRKDIETWRLRDRADRLNQEKKNG